MPRDNELLNQLEEQMNQCDFLIEKDREDIIKQLTKIPMFKENDKLALFFDVIKLQNGEFVKDIVEIISLYHQREFLENNFERLIQDLKYLDGCHIGIIVAAQKDLFEIKNFEKRIFTKSEFNGEKPQKDAYLKTGTFFDKTSANNGAGSVRTKTVVFEYLSLIHISQGIVR